MPGSATPTPACGVVLDILKSRELGPHPDLPQPVAPYGMPWPVVPLRVTQALVPWSAHACRHRRTYRTAYSVLWCLHCVEANSHTPALPPVHQQVFSVPWTSEHWRGPSSCHRTLPRCARSLRHSTVGTCLSVVPLPPSHPATSRHCVRPVLWGLRRSSLHIRDSYLVVPDWECTPSLVLLRVAVNVPLPRLQPALRSPHPVGVET